MLRIAERPQQEQGQEPATIRFARTFGARSLERLLATVRRLLSWRYRYERLRDLPSPHGRLSCAFPRLFRWHGFLTFVGVKASTIELASERQMAATGFKRSL